MKKLAFPKHFKKTAHPVCNTAFQWRPSKHYPVFVSIIGGGFGLYGDGVNTFEIMIGDEVTGFLTKDEINAKLEGLTNVN